MHSILIILILFCMQINCMDPYGLLDPTLDDYNEFAKYYSSTDSDSENNTENISLNKAIFSKATKRQRAKIIYITDLPASHSDYDYTKASKLTRQILNQSDEHICPISGCKYHTSEHYFKRKSALKDHIMAYHSKETPFLCLYCNRRFTQTNVIKSHIKNKHQGKITCFYKILNTESQNADHNHIETQTEVQHPDPLILPKAQSFKAKKEENKLTQEEVATTYIDQ